MGYVYCGDVLEKTIKAKYILLNRHDDALGFSEIILDETLNKTIKGLPEPDRQLSENIRIATPMSDKDNEQKAPRQLTLF